MGVPVVGSKEYQLVNVAEWTKAADQGSVPIGIVGSNPTVYIFIFSYIKS